MIGIAYVETHCTGFTPRTKKCACKKTIKPSEAVVWAPIETPELVMHLSCYLKFANGGKTK